MVYALVGLSACILTAAAVKLQAMLHKPWQHSSPPACIIPYSFSILKCNLSVQSCRTAVVVHLGCMTNKQLFVPKDGFHSNIILLGCNQFFKGTLMSTTALYVTSILNIQLRCYHQWEQIGHVNSQHAQK